MGSNGSYNGKYGLLNTTGEITGGTSSILNYLDKSIIELNSIKSVEFSFYNGVLVNKGVGANAATEITASGNWRTAKIFITEGKHVKYYCSSGSNANIISFVDENDLIISRVIANSGSKFYEGIEVAPTSTVYALITTFNPDLSSSYYNYEDILNTSEKMQEVYSTYVGGRTLTVDINQATDESNLIFNTITEAANYSISNDKIVIKEGIYEEHSISIVDVEVECIGFVWVKGELPDNASTAEIDDTSTINPSGEYSIKIPWVTCKNMRYPIHSDYGVIGTTERIKDTRMTHLGNSGAFNYRVLNTTGDEWDVFRAQSGWGAGTKSGVTQILENCLIESVFRAFSNHNNANFNQSIGSSNVIAKNCHFKSDGIDLDGSYVDFTPDITIQLLGSYADDKIVFENCIANGAFVLYSTSIDNREFPISIKGLPKGMQIVRNAAGGGKSMTDQTDTRSCLVLLLTADSDSVNEITVSGTAKLDVFNIEKSITGSTGLPAYVKSGLWRGNVLSNLGDLTSSSKTLTVTVDGVDTDIVFSGSDYSSMSVNDFLTEVNTGLSGSGVTATWYWQGLDFFVENEEIEYLLNTGTTGIARGKAIKKNGFGQCALFTNSDNADDFYGYACEDIPINKKSACKTSGYQLRIWLSGLDNFTDLSDDTNIYVDTNGDFTTTSTSNVLVSTVISNNNIYLG